MIQASDPAATMEIVCVDHEGTHRRKLEPPQSPLQGLTQVHSAAGHIACFEQISYSQSPFRACDVAQVTRHVAPRRAEHRATQLLRLVNQTRCRY
jgi:hypothetical protein